MSQRLSVVVWFRREVFVACSYEGSPVRLFIQFKVEEKVRLRLSQKHIV